MDFISEAKENVPQMRDRILLILPAKKFQDIRTSSGKDSLRKVPYNFRLVFDG